MCQEEEVDRQGLSLKTSHPQQDDIFSTNTAYKRDGAPAEGVGSQQRHTNMLTNVNIFFYGTHLI